MTTTIKQSHQASNLKENNSKVLCKKCNSNQVVANKRGYSFGKMFKVVLITFVVTMALAMFFPSLDNVEVTSNLNIIGFLMFYIGVPLAIIRGFIGRSNIVIGCMNCGNKWIPGKK